MGYAIPVASHRPAFASFVQILCHQPCVYGFLADPEFSQVKLFACREDSAAPFLWASSHVAQKLIQTLSLHSAMHRNSVV